MESITHIGRLQAHQLDPLRMSDFDDGEDPEQHPLRTCPIDGSRMQSQKTLRACTMTSCTDALPDIDEAMRSIRDGHQHHPLYGDDENVLHSYNFFDLPGGLISFSVPYTMCCTYKHSSAYVYLTLFKSCFSPGPGVCNFSSFFEFPAVFSNFQFLFAGSCMVTCPPTPGPTPKRHHQPFNLEPPLFH